MRRNFLLILFALLLLGGCKKDREAFKSGIRESSPTFHVRETSASISGIYEYRSDLKSVTVVYDKNSDFSSASTIPAEIHHDWYHYYYYHVRLPDLEPGTTYYYYCIFDTGYGSSEGKQWSFTTQETQTFTVNGVTFEMVAVEGGTFIMGGTSDASNDEFPTHSVTLSDYCIGKFEVTQELWLAVMGSWPGTAPSVSYGLGDDYPAYYVSWDDCQEFITELNQLTGRMFRLPTEAEWEYAARGGNMSGGYKYSGSNSIGEVAWYYDNSGSKTHTVGTKSPNELGIYNMSGNVWEWCQDWYDSYGSGSQTNPQGPSSGSYRVYRGGSWYDYAQSCRVSNRYSYTPDLRISNLGFRLVVSQ